MPITMDEKRKSFLAASRQRVDAWPARRSTRRRVPGRRSVSFSVSVSDELVADGSAATLRRPGRPSNLVPSGRPPEASIGAALTRSLVPPLADGVEVLQREAERVHPRVAARADRIGAVLLHPLAHRQRPCRRCSLSFERRHVRRRRRRRRAEQVLEHPLAAHHRRGAVRIRRDRQNAALPEQAAARARRCSVDAPEVVAVDVRDAVVLAPAARSRTCSSRVSRSSTLRSSRTMLSKNSSVSAATRRAGFVEVREQSPDPASRSARSAGSSHCPAKLLTSASTRIREHPPHLLLEHRRIASACRCSASASSSSSGMLLQRKNERREASSRSLSTIGGARATLAGSLLDAEQEIRADQQPRQRELDAATRNVAAPAALRCRTRAAAGYRRRVTGRR